MKALDLVYIPLAVVTAPWWAGKKRHGWRERFGHVGEPPRGWGSGGRRRVMLHAVSVGEVNALRSLVPRLVGDVDVVVSATTDTGLARARALFGETCWVVRYPLDFSWAVERFLEVVRPNVVGLVELEVWPNFVGACVGRGVKVGVINGRLSERSFRGYRRISGFFGGVLRKLSFVGCQDAEYLGRFEALGLPRGVGVVTGSMKWDAIELGEGGGGGTGGAREAGERLAREMGIDLGRPVVVAGSTAPGEHELLHAAVPAGVQLVCAPRKPEWFEGAAAALPGCVRRSEGRPGGAGTERFLLDSIGELRGAYAIADVVVIGRSFGGLFGSDPIEPIALGKATVIGPAVSDFAGVVSAFEEAGGIVRTTAEGLGGEIRRLLGDSGAREALARGGRGCIMGQKGSSERHAAMLRAAAGL